MHIILKCLFFVIYSSVGVLLFISEQSHTENERSKVAVDDSELHRIDQNLAGEGKVK